MFTAAEIAEHRADAESLMQDTFRAYKPSGAVVVDRLRKPAFTDMGTTPGKTQGPSASSADTATRTVRVGDVDVDVVAAGLHLPIGAALPAVGWEYECEAVGAASDPAGLGRRYRVVNVPAKSYATARRLDVVDITDLEES